MQPNTVRSAYLLDTLSKAILDDPTPFYDAFAEGEDVLASFMTALWETHCTDCGAALAEHPFFPVIEPYILEDTDEGFLALLTLALPKTKTASPMMAAIVFGSAMDPRVFAATPARLKNGETWQITESRLQGKAVAVGMLYQGCDNGMQLFDPPTPQKVDRDTPISARRRETAFVDAVVSWCMDHD